MGQHTVSSVTNKGLTLKQLYVCMYYNCVPTPQMDDYTPREQLIGE